VLGPRRLRFDATLDAPAQARKAIVAVLFEVGRRTSIPMVELVVTEIVSNAVVHAEGPVDIVVRVEDDTLRVEVTDRSPDRPLVRRIPGPTGGYGLPMIDSLSNAWGADHHEDHKVVWADIDLAVAREW
jgi:anti-sigma regulatory factor (Ser/Thr protein kinase)